MVRLAARSFLHMLPEEVDEGFDHPFYAQVVRINNSIVTFRSLEGGEGVVSRNVAVQHVVSSREVRQTGELSLLRRSVAVDVDVRMASFVAATHQASPVPPIVALLLQHVLFNLNDWSHDNLKGLQVTIMNRVLGRSGETASNAIEDPKRPFQQHQGCVGGLTRVLVAQQSFHFNTPWITPISSMEGALPCLIALGNPFANRQLSVSNDARELFDPFVDDDEHEITEPESILTNNSHPARSLPVKRYRDNSESVSRVSYHSALDKAPSIVQLLRDDPDLLNHFLKIRQSNVSRSPTSANTDDKWSDVGTRQSAVRSSDPRSIYAFAARQDQQYIHDQVTAEKHKGWLESGGSNFDKLSASAEFTKAPPAECLEDVIDATRVFLVYAREYCCEQLISLTENIVQFLDGTLKRVTWNRAELPYVVYWMNDVLEDFREAIAARSDISQVRQRCTTDDRLLRDLMFVKLHRQVDELKHLQATTALHRTKRYLSNEGCTEDSSGCPSDRGHFVPKKFPEVVKQEITKRFGGMKQQHGHL
ncbi:Hypothetical protein PHPALM_17964 [Phytophthora palmivora]|uniref:Uncharacterized protein n=1 Tax=Phytophthora palmivora TaxID=4796 RepID=A0A2P4XL05_9STRA|nr:Hypothetical protein PHPALM_17964 [Phytophthora palmivora]